MQRKCYDKIEPRNDYIEIRIRVILTSIRVISTHPDDIPTTKSLPSADNCEQVAWYSASSFGVCKQLLVAQVAASVTDGSPVSDMTGF